MAESTIGIKDVSDQVCYLCVYLNEGSLLTSDGVPPWTRDCHLIHLITARLCSCQKWYSCLMKFEETIMPLLWSPVTCQINKAEVFDLPGNQTVCLMMGNLEHYVFVCARQRSKTLICIQGLLKGHLFSHLLSMKCNVLNVK